MALHERRSLLRNLRRGFHDRRERRRTSVRGRRRRIFPCRHQRHVATSRPFQKGRLPQGILWPSGWILPQGVQQAPEIGRDTSELQSRFDLVCRLLLEKKKKKK